MIREGNVYVIISTSMVPGTSRGGGYPQAGVKIGTVVCDMIIISKKTMTKYNF